MRPPTGRQFSFGARCGCHYFRPHKENVPSAPCAELLFRVAGRFRRAARPCGFHCGGPGGGVGDGLAIDDYKKANLYGWDSAYNPQYLVDLQERMVALFMTQLMPDGGVDLVKKFKVLTYQALVK